MSSVKSQFTLTSKQIAFRFVILLGVVSLFADMAHDGARSVMGPYLIELGANAFIVGVVVGFAEFIGYALRFVAGHYADRTNRYWAITIVGYICNLVAVPLLAFAGQWQVAAILVILERFGKAIHTPTRDVMLSHAGHQVGMGWAFGVHKALDQIGAMLGPLMVAGALYVKGTYQSGFIALTLPAIIAIIVLFYARHLYPKPDILESKKQALEVEIKSDGFWLFFISAAFMATGFANFALISFHFAKASVLSLVWIPIAYAIAMGVEVITVPIMGRLFDRYRFRLLIGMTMISSLFAPLVFLTSTPFCLLGVIFWGIGMGGQESLMRAVIPELVAKKKRASAYGLFYVGYGFFSFVGSMTFGLLYDLSLYLLVIFSMLSQLLAIPFLWRVGNMRTKKV